MNLSFENTNYVCNDSNFTNNTHFRLNITADWTLMNPADSITIGGCVTGLGCEDSSFMYQMCPCITNYQDPDLPALYVCLQYFTQTEVSTRLLFK